MAAIAASIVLAFTVICLCGVAGFLLYQRSGQVIAARATEPIPTATLAATRPRPTATQTRQPSPTPETPIEPDATREPVPTLAQPTSVPRATVAREEPSLTLEQIEAAVLPPRDLFEIAIRFGKIPSDTLRASETDPAYTIGTRQTFTVFNVDTEEHFEAEAELRAQTEHASWWVAVDAEVEQADLEASARVFEEQTYPTNRALFGNEWSPGVDGDPRVHIYLGEVPGVGGYFSSADEFPRSVNPFSNEKEIFYINTNNALPGSDYFDGILAHEFQHMIHWNVDRNEELWINEGLSELAAAVNGFEVGDAITSYMREPDLPVTRWSDQTYPFYGSAYLFLTYFYERFGEEAVSEFVQTEADGPRAFDEVLADEGITFDELFADWVVANWVDDATLEDGRFGYQESLERAPTPEEAVERYPQVDSGEIHQYGTDYIHFEPDGEEGTLRVEFDGDEMVSLLPTKPHEGEWMAWSNRGDDSDATLTRAFNLADLDSATLRFWTWYDLEPDYDYSYVAVSTDSGTQWQILQATDSTDSNPNGNSFGFAFTGRSGRADDEQNPLWQEQTVDLSPFVGQEILLRFETITDDALNLNGFVVDDISIPELGYTESFEEGLGDWEASGYARVDNVLPQEFLVQMVAEQSDGTHVTPVALDEGNSAIILVENFGTEVENVTLVVTGATSHTSEQTRYEYSARLE